MGNWEVDLSLIASWLKEQDQETIVGVTVALNELRDVGPGLGRPLAVSYTHLDVYKRQVPRFRFRCTLVASRFRRFFVNLPHLYFPAGRICAIIPSRCAWLALQVVTHRCKGRPRQSHRTMPQGLSLIHI